MEKKLKIILCVALIILIALISFVGVYSKDVAFFKNIIPSYSLSSEFSGKRLSRFIIDESASEKIYDKDGNEVDSIPEGANEEEYRKETIKENPDEIRTSENYKKAKEIADRRLKTLGVEDYKIRLNETTGEMAVELEDNENTDTLLQDIQCKGDFSITDSEDGTLLIGKSDIRKASVVYANTTGTGVTVYLDIKFNDEGTEKLAQVSRDYLHVHDENEGEEVDENLKKVTFTMESSEMLTTYFGEEITNGELTVSIGTATDADSLQEYLEQGNFYAMLINDEDMPIKYTVDYSEVTKGNLEGNAIYYIIGAILVIFVVATIYLVVRYKLNGVVGALSIGAFIAILLLLVRWTNTEISLNSVVAIATLIILDVYLLTKMFNKIKEDSNYENVRKCTVRTYLDNIEIIIVAIIIAIVFTFMREEASFSFGMTLFYGIISIGVTNLTLLRTMLLAKYSDK